MQDFQTVTSEAVKKAGGGAKLARALNLHRQAIYQWRHVPHQHVETVEKLSGIPRHLLRPDLYPEERERIAS